MDLQHIFQLKKHARYIALGEEHATFQLDARLASFETVAEKCCNCKENYSQAFEL